MTGLRAGQLARRLRLQSRSVSQDSFGGQNLAWVDVATVWAEIRPITGRELENARRIASEVSHPDPGALPAVAGRFQSGSRLSRALQGAHLQHPRKHERGRAQYRSHLAGIRGHG